MALETLKSSCSHYDGRRVWLGKAALRSRLVDVRGWRGGRRFRDSILLEEVESVARSSGTAGGNLVFSMRDGSERSLRVSAPGIWRMQIDYRLRRIAGLTDAEPADASKLPAITLDQTLPTADEVEHAFPIGEGVAEEEHGSELAAWPRFEAEEATIEIVAGADLEPEFMIEPVAVSEDGSLVPTELDEERTAEAEADEPEDVALVDALSFELEAEELEELPEIVLAEAGLEIEEAATEVDPVGDAEVIANTKLAGEPEPAPVPEARIVSVPPPEDLHEIGDDIVFDMAMDATTHEDVVIGWLSPMESEVLVESSASDSAEEDEDSVAEDEVQASDDAEPLMADIEEALEAQAPAMEATPVVVPDAQPTELEAALALEPTAAELELEAKPLIAEIEVEAPDVGIEAGLEVQAPDLVMEAGLAVENPESLDVESLDVDALEEEALEEELPYAHAPYAEVPVPDLTVEPMLEADVVEPREALSIASRPFELSRLYESAEPQEEELDTPAEPEPEPELQAAEPEVTTAEPEVTTAEPEAATAEPEPAPEISLEPVNRRERRRRQSMANLRPMSLAELIRESEPRWTRLAEMD